MKKELATVGVIGVLAFWAASSARPGLPGAEGLDTVIRDLPHRVMTVREMVEILGNRCGMEVAVGDEVTGELSFERFPMTARSVLDSVLPSRGYLYLDDGGVLRVMRDDRLRAFFRDRAETRVYGAELTPGLVTRLLEGHDLVSTLGYLGLDPERGVVHVHDLPCYADRVERILVSGGTDAEGVTL